MVIVNILLALAFVLSPTVALAEEEPMVEPVPLASEELTVEPVPLASEEQPIGLAAPVVERVDYSVPWSGVFDSQPFSYAEGYVRARGLNEHYAFWRSGERSYTLVIGDIRSDAGGLYGSSLRRLDWVANSGSSWTWVQSETHDQAVHVSSSRYVVWSDVGSYPQLDDGLWSMVTLSVLLSVIVLVIWLLHQWWSWGVRLRGANNA